MCTVSEYYYRRYSIEILRFSSGKYLQWVRCYFASTCVYNVVTNHNTAILYRSEVNAIDYMCMDGGNVTDASYVDKRA